MSGQKRLSSSYRQSKRGAAAAAAGGADADKADGDRDGREEKKARSDSDSDGAGAAGDEECCICLDDLNLRFKTPCNHTFCFLCIKGVVQQDVAQHKSPACPLCRGALDEKFLSGARMKKSAYDEANAGSDIKYQWRYSGNKGGWWLYDDATNARLEELFAEYEADQSKDGVQVEIGSRKYVISFADMKQKNAGDPRRSRRINRVPKSAILASQGANAQGSASANRGRRGRNRDAVKGQAGVAFDD